MNRVQSQKLGVLLFRPAAGPRAGLLSFQTVPLGQRRAAVTTNNYAGCLKDLERHAEARSLMRKTMPVARRVLGKLHEVTIKMLWAYVETLYEDDNATLADLREAVNTLEDSARGARRVYGTKHPLVVGSEYHIEHSRAALAAREAPSPGSA